MNTNLPNPTSNIYNAMHVLIKSYDNVKKLFDTLHAESGKFGYVPTGSKQYLTWLSMGVTYGWLPRHFVKTFTKKGVENELFTVEVNLHGIPNGVPVLILGRHEYDNKPGKIGTFEDAANFNHRIWNTKRFDITPEDGFLQYDEPFYSKPLTDSGDWGRSRGFQRAAFIKIPLPGLAADEVKSRIFGNLDKLVWPP